MKIYKEKAGVISKKAVWVCIHKEYLYIADTILKLFLILLTEWKNNKHFVG